MVVVRRFIVEIFKNGSTEQKTLAAADALDNMPLMTVVNEALRLQMLEHSSLEGWMTRITPALRVADTYTDYPLLAAVEITKGPCRLMRGTVVDVQGDMRTIELELNGETIEIHTDNLSELYT